MTSEQFFKACVNAPPGVRAKIEMVLRGDETIVPHADEDARTCTKAQAGRRLNASRPTVYAMIRRGELETVTINGCERVLVKSINAVARGETGGATDADAAAKRRARLSDAGRKGAAARIRALERRRTAKGNGGAA